MSIVSELEVIISGDTSNLKSKLNNADQQIGSFANRAAKKAADAAKSIAKMGAGLGVAVVGFSINQAVEFESNFANVKKTVDATAEELDGLKAKIREMATDTTNPLSALDDAHTTLTNIMALGGQLGVPTADLDEFTETVGAMTVATDLGAEEAATFFAQFANVTGLDSDQYRDVGNAIVTMGNNMATNESNIATFAQRLAPLASFDFDAADILGYAGGMASLGISAELGATNLLKTVGAITKAVATGDDLQGFADIAGMTADEFKSLSQNDPSAALDAFVQGLSNLDADEQIIQLQKIGITSQEQIGTLQRMASGWDTVKKGLDLSNSSMKSSNALMDEAKAKADTTAGKINQFKNKVRDLGIELGDKLLPHFNVFVDGLLEIAKGDFGGGLATMGDAIAGLLEDITGWDFSTVEEGLAAWSGAFETAAVIVALVLDDAKRKIDAILLDIGISLGQAAIDLANNPLIQLTPQAGMINQMVAPAEQGLENLKGQRANMDIADQFTEQLYQANQASDIDLANLIFPEDMSGVAEEMGLRGRALIDDMMGRLITEGDWENLGVMIPFAEAMDFDMTGLTELINLKLDEAIMNADEEAFHALLPTATMLDIDTGELESQLQAGVSEAAAAREYTGTVDIYLDANVTVNSADIDKAVQSAANASGLNISASGSVRAFHSGGTFYHPSGEGLAFLKSGETIRTEAQEKALQRRRGGASGGSSDTYVVNSYGQSEYGLVRQIKRAQRDMGS